MKRLFLLLLVQPLLLMFLANSACAQSVALYVRNHAYAKPLFQSDNTLYAVADDIFPMVQLTLRAQGRVLCGATPDYKGPICPGDTANSFLYIDGKPVTAGTLVRHDKVWISIPSLAKAIGYSYQYNKETGIADLFPGVIPSSLSFVPDQSPKSTTKGESKKSDGKKDKKKAEESEISVEIQNQTVTQDPNTYEVRVFFDVKNVGKDDAKGVTATLSYLDGEGKSIVSRIFNIGALASGSSVHESDYWINTTRIYSVKPDVQLDWEGKKKR